MKVKEILNEIITEVREVDYYTPIKVDFEENDIKDKELFYYRVINPKSSFVEVSINSVTKKIVNITLVSVNDIEEKKPDMLSLSEVVGNPVIDMSVFKKGHIVTDNAEFSIMTQNKELLILQKNIDVCTSLIIDNTTLLLDTQNNIVGFVFKAFSEEEWRELNEGIEAAVSIEETGIIKFD